MKKILIVEDQFDIQRLLKIVLSSEDRQLLFTGDGTEALNVAKETIPDLILLDIMLRGGIDGYEVAKTLKSDPTTATCTIIIMSAKGQKQNRVNALDAGADDYIGKPFDLVDLKSKVETFLDR